MGKTERDERMKVKCEYCGRFNDSEREICATCGAPLAIMDEDYKKWKTRIKPQLEKHIVKEWTATEIGRNMLQFSIIFFLVSPMLTYLVSIGALRLAEETSIIYTLFHFSLALLIIVVDIVHNFTSISKTKYIVTKKGFFTVESIVKEDGEYALNLHPNGNENQIVTIKTDTKPIFSYQVAPSRYPIPTAVADI